MLYISPEKKLFASAVFRDKDKPKPDFLMKWQSCNRFEYRVHVRVCDLDGRGRDAYRTRGRHREREVIITSQTTPPTRAINT